MSRLIQKLLHLGYKQDKENKYVYIKYSGMCNIYAGLDSDMKKFYLWLDDVEAIYNQHELNLLNQTFELMCKDWKILKECGE